MQGEHSGQRHSPRSRLVREKERESITGVPRSTWYLRQSKGTAPKPVPIGENAVAWIEQELFDWVDAQIAQRDQVKDQKQKRIAAAVEAKKRRAASA